MEYKFYNNGYKYIIKQPSSEKWTSDEQLNYLLLEKIKEIEHNWIIPFIWFVVSLIMLGLSIPIIYLSKCDSINILSGIIITLSSISTIFSFLVFIDREDYCYCDYKEIENIFIRTPEGIRQTEEQDFKKQQELDKEKKQKAIELNEVYKTLNDSKLNDTEKIEKIKDYMR